MEYITYSLKGNQNNSNEYYEEIKSFTDEILNEFDAHSTIFEFKEYVQENGMDKIRSNEEYIFEFLMLGTFWRVYSSKASKLDENPQKLLESFALERQKNKPAKEIIDLIRGIVMTPFLMPKEENDKYSLELDLNGMDKLLGYLLAAGDFSQEVERLKIWKSFLKVKTQDEVLKFLSNTILYAEWFESVSKVTFGKYTPNLDNFLKNKQHEHLFKEDVIFCSRKEVEYHLNMVGAEIMNRAFNKEFEDRPRKALLLPGCMRISQEICKAEETKLGLRCIGCVKNCNVHQLTDMGEIYEFEVYIISHESSAFSKSSKEDRKELGIVGVACVTNLIAGGWKSDSIGIPAQCVLLDSASCKNHWNNKGIPTEINVDHLMKLFKIKLEEPHKVEPIPAC
jgi:hypothetical protein